MRFRLSALAVALAVTTGLGACVEDHAYYGPPPPYADLDYYAYYDGYYGPFYGGYWGPGGSFYYWDQGHGHYHRDTTGHFRREGGAGFNSVHGHAPPTGGRGGGGHPGGPH